MLLTLTCAVFVHFVFVSQLTEGDQLQSHYPQVTGGHLVRALTDLCRALLVLPLKKLQLGYSEAKASAELKREVGE